MHTLMPLIIVKKRKLPSLFFWCIDDVSRISGQNWSLIDKLMKWPHFGDRLTIKTKPRSLSFSKKKLTFIQSHAHHFGELCISIMN